jgi:REP element-mobilizing transposase RayT
MKYQNLIKDAKELYNENYKSLKKEIVKDTQKWKDLFSKTGRLNIVKMATLPKEIHGFNTILSKLKRHSILKFIWKHKSP